MQSKNHPPRKCHTDWHNWLRANVNYCVACGGPAEELHHIIGSAGKENKVWIGQWACTMLCSACNHDDSRLQPKHEQMIQLVRGPISDYWRRFGEPPMETQELMAICTWSR